MVPWRSNNEGEVTEDVLQWYRRFAEGQPGVIVVEATGIRDIPSGPLLRIGHDRYLHGLKKLVDSVREASQGKNPPADTDYRFSDHQAAARAGQIPRSFSGHYR